MATKTDAEIEAIYNRYPQNHLMALRAVYEAGIFDYVAARNAHEKVLRRAPLAGNYRRNSLANPRG